MLLYKMVARISAAAEKLSIAVHHTGDTYVRNSSQVSQGYVVNIPGKLHAHGN